MNSAVPKPASITKRLVTATVLILVYMFVGLIMRFALVGSGSSGGGSDQAKAVAFFEAIGALIASALIAAIVVFCVKRFLLKRTSFRVLPISLLLGLLFAAPNFYSTAKRDADFSTAASTLQSNPRFLEAGTHHVERATEEVISHYPALKNPILDASLPPNPSLNDLQKRRDAYKDASSAVQTVQTNFQELFRSALLKDDPRFGTDLKELGVAQNALPTAISGFDEGAVKSAVPKVINLYTALSRKLEASTLVISFLIENYGKWQVSNGRFVFDTQQNADTFNKLSAAENEAATNFSAQ